MKSTLVIYLIIQLLLLMIIWNVSKAPGAIAAPAVLLTALGLPLISIIISLLIAFIGTRKASIEWRRILWWGWYFTVSFWILAAVVLFVVVQQNSATEHREMDKAVKQQKELRKTTSINLAEQVPGANWYWNDSLEACRIQIKGHPDFYIYQDCFERIIVEEPLPGLPRQPDSSFLADRLAYYGNLLLNEQELETMLTAQKDGDACTNNEGSWYAIFIPCNSAVIQGGVARNVEKHNLQVVVSLPRSRF